MYVDFFYVFMIVSCPSCCVCVVLCPCPYPSPCFLLLFHTAAASCNYWEDDSQIRVLDSTSCKPVK